MDLSKYARLIAPNTRIIESSLLMHTCKECLKQNDREDLSPYILSIKKSKQTISIKTNKPIINCELARYKDSFIQAFSTEAEQYQVRFI